MSDIQERLFEFFPQIKKYWEEPIPEIFFLKDISVRKFNNPGNKIKYTIWARWYLFDDIYQLKINVKENSKNSYEITQVLVNGFFVSLADATQYLPIDPFFIRMCVEQ